MKYSPRHNNIMEIILTILTCWLICFRFLSDSDSNPCNKDYMQWLVAVNRKSSIHEVKFHCDFRRMEFDDDSHKGNQLLLHIQPN